MAEVKCLVPAGDWTGEGAVWHAGERAVYWVDINRFLIHRFDPATGATRTWFFTEPPTAIGLTDRADTMVVAIGGRLIFWQPANDARAEFVAPEKNWPSARFNDGRPDPAGNFWVGSMGNNVGARGGDAPITGDIGRVFRVTGQGDISVEKTEVGISNTFCWSPDGTKFYTGDTLKNVINVWDFDASAGTIANERPFFAGFSRGLPDGSAMDRDGFLWNARYGGACIVRVAPDGSIDRVFDMPVAAPTTLTFGGPQLRTAYITSAGGGKGAADDAPLAGSLFSMEVEVPGLPENHFRLGA
jgi:sugar lactone lactonase YvrE